MCGNIHRLPDGSLHPLLSLVIFANFLPKRSNWNEMRSHIRTFYIRLFSNRHMKITDPIRNPILIIFGLFWSLFSCFLDIRPDKKFLERNLPKWSINRSIPKINKRKSFSYKKILLIRMISFRPYHLMHNTHSNASVHRRTKIH